MPTKMSEIIESATENLDKIDNGYCECTHRCICKFGDCDANCCFNICKSIVINLCGCGDD